MKLSNVKIRIKHRKNQIHKTKSYVWGQRRRMLRTEEMSEKVRKFVRKLNILQWTSHQMWSEALICVQSKL